jgi:DNA-binding MarR family transcriptional regulator
MTDHPTTELNEVVHQRARLGILTVTHQASRADFTYLRTALGLTAGNLSQHLAVLEDAGLVTVEKGYEGKRARTWVQLTRAGKQALREEIATLKSLIGTIDDA